MTQKQYRTQPSKIVIGGPRAFMLPHALAGTMITPAPTGRGRRILAALFHTAVQNDYWARYEAEPIMRLRTSDVRVSAGLLADNDNRCVMQALENFEGAVYQIGQSTGTVACPILNWQSVHRGRFIEIAFGAEIAALFRPPIDQWALLNMDQIAALRCPLDHVFYETACHVAQRENPREKFNLEGLSVVAARAPDTGWSQMRRPILDAFQRVANTTGARFHLQVFGAGRLPSWDTLEFTVTHDSEKKQRGVMRSRLGAKMFIIRPAPAKLEDAQERHGVTSAGGKDA